MRLPFKEKEPEPTGWWSASAGGSKTKKTVKDAPRSNRKPAPNRQPARQKQKGRPTSQQKSNSRKKQPTKSQTRTTLSKGIRKPAGKDKSFLDHMEESVCSWCESVEMSNVYYYSAYPVNAIAGNNKPKRRRKLTPVY
mmetsp:Transcript_19813/g.56943  ORF Transcript_19813/g.56943 Transcript_19813/m.56943 type:complete len:138 (-) Transcript_19813:204-617(-)|eukprot:CAMPEP_0181030708 /NCGR_PEP_ID=MMETSP1070-20121207/5860_1 /TAXON_ID=265543 /ORGANISM="Minutocellus polymorphus, Strain NH13" /LENGTH=137 /DNA_ID=CAMNT_0023108071 /DNA_START=97 /DNA_END=510 /DNA_ORIENTATION=+